MQVVRHIDPAEFTRRVMPFLLRREAENCFLVGIAPTLTADTPDVLMLSAHDDAGEVLAVALMTPPRHLVITSGPTEAIDALADYVIGNHLELPGVQGRMELASRFAERYSAATGTVIRERTGMAVHELQAVSPVREIAGALRLASESEIGLVASWIDAFGREINEPLPTGSVALATRRIGQCEVFVWDVNGTPVSMACLAGPTPNGVRVNLVYTSVENRKRGYASASVAALSRRVLDSGKTFCFLYTDLSNPTSNKIYRAIGYQKICEDERILFARPG